MVVAELRMESANTVLSAKLNTHIKRQNQDKLRNGEHIGLKKKEKKEKGINKMDYCFECKKPLVHARLTKGDPASQVLICTNEKCSRVGLCSVMGLKFSKKVKKN